MKGKNVVVTGGNAGIGFETAKAMLEKGANVIIVCRSKDKGQEAVSRLKQLTASDKIDFVTCQLGEQKDIKRAALEISAKMPVLDVLVNNAGTWLSDRTLTPEGVEMQLAVNHLGYFLMTHWLLPNLQRAEEPRVVCVGSDSHLRNPVHWDDLTMEKGYHGLKSYAQSKAANVMFAYYFDRNQPFEKKIAINCLQPGLVHTDIGLKTTNPLHKLAWRVRRTFWKSKTPAEGADTSIYLASSPEVKGQSGKYWDLRKPKPSSPETMVESNQDIMWQYSMEKCSLKDYWHPEI
ncbi:MAG: SDR family oxidoreductase [Bacteroidia bacterium]|nr:SDR family oxidoreductase [Bacteroidia bacterium]